MVWQHLDAEEAVKDELMSCNSGLACCKGAFLHWQDV